MRIDGGTVAELLEIVDDHERPRRDTGIDNPVGANLRTEGYGFNMSFPVGPGDINLLQPLELLNRYLRYEQGVVANFGFGLDPTELAGTQEISGIRKGGSDSNGAGLRYSSDGRRKRCDLSAGSPHHLRA